MKLFPNDKFYFCKKRLQGDIFLLLYFDLDNRGRPDCIIQCIRIWKCDPLPLKVPLIIFKFPIIDGIYDLREFAYLVEEQLDKKKLFLQRMWEKLWKQIKTLILTWKLYYEPIQDKPEKQEFWESYRRFLILMKFLFWWEWSDDWKEENKPP